LYGKTPSGIPRESGAVTAAGAPLPGASFLFPSFSRMYGPVGSSASAPTREHALVLPETQERSPDEERRMTEERLRAEQLTARLEAIKALRRPRA